MTTDSKAEETQDPRPPPMEEATMIQEKTTEASSEQQSGTNDTSAAAASSSSTTTTTSTTPSPRSKSSANNNNNNTRTKKWTDTNSDKHCIQHMQNPFARLGYSISLATGFYAVEPLDKKLSIVLGYVLLAIFLLLIYVFYQGVQDGLEPVAAAAVVMVSDVEKAAAAVVEQITEDVLVNTEL
mmetsp:Transcript_18777/g.24186  ORF Transcript_18777/g.24186 Transcript_18777/m.24186 type:complete len:183 (+) Transcript_18777:167-715(+)|eukprot:CAMPEP_0198139772 /NCGR_PEP_ID=MMETSP1443-20131203/3013_1 /TAXON_ID=186043 /ORGANISM="Entomoneis sp., Strain CCMP2396" /LENGTH=182 /DNA_ID=CAMNT_0043801991 /DNA_START=105 /DNA_END=653 /DNA_ORIENTATION=-